MSRAGAAVILATGLAIAVLGGAPDTAGAEPPPPSTTPSASVVDTPASAPVTVVRRGGAASGSIAKPEDEQWSVRRMITTVGLGVVALAAAGYAYGRIRSTPPRHPDLVRSSD